MGDRKLTVLELSFGDVQIGPRRSGDSGGSEEETRDLALPSGGGGRLPASPKTLVGAVLALGVLGGIAVAVKSLRGSDHDQATLDDPEFSEAEEFEPAEFED